MFCLGEQRMIEKSCELSDVKKDVRNKRANAQ